ncbi:MAG: folate-binding protein [Alphaproteobacteria bacterium]|nr:folate-binding protein [Alphaproteobacteria bacterium]
MTNQNPPHDFIAALDDRRLLRVTGEDAFDFLQNIITNDMNRLAPGGLLYACLLSPQGQWLHDFFIFTAPEGGYLLDVEKEGHDDLLRRLTIFKLRAKVTISAEDAMHAYAAIGEVTRPADMAAYPDPRLPELGRRLYGKLAQDDVTPAATQAYDDYCISLGVPCAGKAIERGRDVMADANLDLLNAVAWDKGCFIGQEVAARMHHRNLAKKRLVLLEGENLETGAVLRAGEAEAGRIRHVSGDRRHALALFKTAVLSHSGPEPCLPDGKTVKIHVPAYLSLVNH